MFFHPLSRQLAPTHFPALTHCRSRGQFSRVYECVFEGGDVAEFAWKDQQIVLFMDTIANGRKTMNSWQRRLAKTNTNAKTSRLILGDEAIKELSIPEFIDLYNHFMNGVDTADQSRNYYTIQRVHCMI